MGNNWVVSVCVWLGRAFGVAGLALGIAVADEPEAQLDIAAVQRFMARNRVKPLNIPPTAMTQRQVEEAAHFRFLSVEVPALLGRLENRADADQVAEWAGEAYLKTGTNYDKESRAELLDTGLRFRRAGVHDPLVDWLICRLNDSGGPSFARDNEQLLGSLAHNKRIISFSPWLASWVVKDGHHLIRRSNKPEAEAREIKAIHDLLMADGALTPDEEMIMIPAMLGQHKSQSRNIEKTAETWLALINDERIQPWIRLTARGLYEISLAWNRRGGGWASSVTEEGWQGFKEHMALAREALVEAWRLNPESPAAPTAMIRVVMGGDRGDGETIDLWLERALTARVDFFPAIGAYLWASYPRWGGSHDKMTALGWACALTGRFDTHLPRYGMEEVVRTIVDDRGDGARDYFRRQPMASKLLLHVCGEYLKHAIAAGDRHGEFAWRSRLIASLWVVGRENEAYKQLLSLEAPMHSRARNILARFKVDEPYLRGQAELAALGVLPQWRVAEDNRKAGRAKLAAEMFGKLAEYAKGLDKPVPRAVEASLELCQFEMELESGEWADLRVDPELSLWEEVRGNWTGDDEGGVILTGDILVRRPRIAFLPEIAPPMEFRGVLAFQPDTPRPYGASFMFANRQSGHWFYASFWTADNVWKASILSRDSTTSAPSIEIEPPSGDESFLVRVDADGKISFQLGERVIVENFEMTGRFKPNVPGRVGLGHFSSRDGGVIRFSQLQVRRPGETEATNPDETNAAGEPE